MSKNITNDMKTVLANLLKNWPEPTKKIKGLEYLSVSQFKTVADCPAKWGYDKIDKIPRLPNIYTPFGGEVHQLAEAYFLKSEDLPDVPNDAWDVWGQAIDGSFLPPRGGFTEKQFHSVVTLDDPNNTKIVLNGFMDYVFVKEDGRICIVDFKTTSNLAYAMSDKKKPKKSLNKDFQSNVYAKVLFDAMPDLQEVDCMWLYLGGAKNKNAEDARPRTPSGRKKVEVTITREEAESFFWENIAPLALDIIFYREQGLSAVHLPHNKKSCPKFNGCDYRPHCQNEEITLEIKKQTQKRKENGTMGFDLKDLIRKQNEEKAKEGGKKAPQTQKVSKGDKVNPPDYTEVEIREAEEKIFGDDVPKISKKEAEAKKVEIDEAFPNKEEKKALKAKEKAKEKAEKTEAPKKKRGRPRKKAEPTTDSTPKEKTKKREEEPTQSVADKKIDLTDPNKEDMILMVDCIPMPTGEIGGYAYKDLASYLAPLKRMVEDKNKIPYWDLIKYSEGKTQLAYILRVKLEEEGFAGILYCDSHSKEWAACQDVLIEKANLFCKGIR